jgi:hypothetical protein
VVHLIETQQIPRPVTLTVLYADTRQEIPPLHFGAMQMLDALRQKGYGARVVLPSSTIAILSICSGAVCRRRITTRCAGVRRRSKLSR